MLFVPPVKFPDRHEALSICVPVFIAPLRNVYKMII